MKNIKVLPYKQGSKSAKQLAIGLGCKVLKLENSTWKPHDKALVVNWGNSRYYGYDFFKQGSVVLNHNLPVSLAANKLRTLNLLFNAGVSIPPYTQDKRWALDMTAKGGTVVCRTVLNGHSGEGIVIANTPEEVVDAPLYVKYIPKKQEYRIHVFKGEVIDKQRKARKLEEENPNWQVRNLAGGFVFARNEEHDYPVSVLEQACLAVKALGLDFGAVDIIWNEKHQRPYVLEVNTACGLEGTTVDSYVKAIRNYYEEVVNV